MRRRSLSLCAVLATACSQSAGGPSGGGGPTGVGSSAATGSSAQSTTGATGTSGVGSTSAGGSSTDVAGTGGAGPSGTSTGGPGSGGTGGSGGAPIDPGIDSGMSRPDAAFPPRDADAVDAPPGPVHSGLAVTTNRYDNARSGSNLQETVLTTSNVNMAHFGLLFSRPVDGQVFAEPLYLGGVSMPDGARRDVVFVATAHNTVFAFDATTASATAPLWKAGLGASGPVSGFGCTDMVNEVGITGTPVIDPMSGTLYVVTKGQEGGSWVQRLHALDVLTGKDQPGSPVVITASVAGTGAGTSNGKIAFNPMTQLNRPGLLLHGGTVFLAFGSHCDKGNYHGWILAYDAKTLQQTHAFNLTPNGSGGALWQAGVGLSADDTSLYFSSGNGSVNWTSNPPAVSEGVGRLNMSDLTMADFWIAKDWSNLNNSDADMSTGAILFPYNLLLTGSKDGKLYVLDRTNLGKYDAATDHIRQTFTTPGKAAGQRGHLHSGPIYYNVPNKGDFAFMWPEESELIGYAMDASHKLIDPPVQANLGKPGHPGGMVTLSANGSQPGTGILWCSTPKQDAWHQTVPGMLTAVDAADLSHVLWTSDQNAGRDALGNFAKFTAPTVVAGHVYVATFSNALRVYGPLP